MCLGLQAESNLRYQRSPFLFLSILSVLKILRLVLHLEIFDFNELTFHYRRLITHFHFQEVPELDSDSIIGIICEGDLVEIKVSLDCSLKVPCKLEFSRELQKHVIILLMLSCSKYSLSHPTCFRIFYLKM